VIGKCSSNNLLSASGCGHRRSAIVTNHALPLRLHPDGRPGQFERPSRYKKARKSGLLVGHRDRRFVVTHYYYCRELHCSKPVVVVPQSSHIVQRLRAAVGGSTTRGLGVGKDASAYEGGSERNGRTNMQMLEEAFHEANRWKICVVTKSDFRDVGNCLGVATGKQVSRVNPPQEWLRAVTAAQFGSALGIPLLPV